MTGGRCSEEDNPAPGPEVLHQCLCDRIANHLGDHRCSLCRATWARPCAICAAEQSPGRCAKHERPHEDCHRVADANRQQYLADLDSFRAQHRKDLRFAAAVRQMVGPGVKHKALRVEELRSLAREIYGEQG